ncbi:hypothetical protein F5Y17DRAFT_309507 [Xylariaceae sp. FL0594]|nr:hypothetical protein F5Y17DRAFT_309507 [Xylariaceae sp. FL0594]
MKFSHFALGVSSLFGVAMASPMVSMSERDTNNASSPLSERQTGPCSIWTPGTQLSGDGSPRPRYLHKQLSQTITCDQSNGCSVGQQESESFSIGFSLSSGKQITEWLSGGFSVTKTWITGNSYTCNGGAGQTVCIWQSVAHTAYKVRNGVFNSCTGFSPSGDEIEISSPNEDNRGGGFYCVQGTCRAQGDQYWDD